MKILTTLPNSIRNLMRLLSVITITNLDNVVLAAKEEGGSELIVVIAIAILGLIVLIGICLKYMLYH